jgi:hypothetical protein
MRSTHDEEQSGQPDESSHGGVPAMLVTERKEVEDDVGVHISSSGRNIALIADNRYISGVQDT